MGSKKAPKWRSSKSSFRRYHKLAKRRVHVMISAEAHAFIVARAMKKNISIYQAGTEMLLAGAGLLPVEAAATNSIRRAIISGQRTVRLDDVWSTKPAKESAEQPTD